MDDPGRTRTSDLRIRNPTLYPAELRGRNAAQKISETPATGQCFDGLTMDLRCTPALPGGTWIAYDSGMRGFLARLGEAIQRGFASFRQSMVALFDQKSTAEDVKGLMWIAGITLVIVVIAMILKAHERRSIM